MRTPRVVSCARTVAGAMRAAAIAAAMRMRRLLGAGITKTSEKSAASADEVRREAEDHGEHVVGESRRQSAEGTLARRLLHRAARLQIEGIGAGRLREPEVRDPTVAVNQEH